MLPFFLQAISVHNHSNRPKNKHRWFNYLMCLIFNLWRIKIYKVLYCAAIHSIQCFTCGVMQKEWKPPSPLVPCRESTAPFPTSFWPRPFPKPTPFNPTYLHILYSFKLAEDDISPFLDPIHLVLFPHYQTIITSNWTLKISNLLLWSLIYLSGIDGHMSNHRSSTGGL